MRFDAAYALAFWIAIAERQLDVADRILGEMERQKPKLRIAAVRGHRINEGGFRDD